MNLYRFAKRYLIFLIVASCSVYVSKAQQYQFKELVTREVIQLNSASKIGGQTRSYLPLSIPEGCIGLIYSINANNPDEPVAHNFSMIAGLASLAATGNMALGGIVSKLSIPTGTESADVYLMLSLADVQNFLARKNFTYIPDYSRMNRSASTVFIPLPPGMSRQTVYLGLRNPSAFNKIVITVNATTVFEQ